MICFVRAFKETYFYSYWKARCLMKASTHHSPIATTEHFAILEVFPLDLLVPLASRQIKGAFAVNLDLLFGNYDTSSSPKRQKVVMK